MSPRFGSLFGKLYHGIYSKWRSIFLIHKKMYHMSLIRMIISKRNIASASFIIRKKKNGMPWLPAYQKIYRAALSWCHLNMRPFGWLLSKVSLRPLRLSLSHCGNGHIPDCVPGSHGRDSLHASAYHLIPYWIGTFSYNLKYLTPDSNIFISCSP